MYSKDFISNIKNKLLQEKQELINQSTSKVDIDVDGDETDEIQGNVLIELNSQLATRANNKIFNIDIAIKKIAESVYGQCEDCLEEIPEKRLKFNPSVLLCVSCAEEREIESRQRKRS
jgi:DnaK suppressor protein